MTIALSMARRARGDPGRYPGLHARSWAGGSRIDSLPGGAPLAGGSLVSSAMPATGLAWSPMPQPAA